MPFSLLWFALATVFFVVQITTIGSIIIMFGGGLLLLVPVNAGFISLALESAFGRVSRWWLLAPCLWFGGYAVLAVMSQTAFDKLSTDLAQKNGRTHLAFSPESDILLVKNDSGRLGYVANKLVEFYDLPVAYESNSGFRSTYAFRVGSKESCSRVFEDLKAGSTGVYAQRVRQYPELRYGSGDFEYVKDLCILHSREQPTQSTYAVTSKGRDEGGFLVPFWLEEIDVTAPGGQTIQLSRGAGAPYKWWPAIVIMPGCEGTGHCSVGFLRQPNRWIGGPDPDALNQESAAPVIAQALGLKFSPASLNRQRFENAAMPQSINAPN